MMVHLGKNNSTYQYLMGTNLLGSSSAVKDQGVFMDKNCPLAFDQEGHWYPGIQ